jgi:hypothetical protein
MIEGTREAGDRFGAVRRLVAAFQSACLVSALDMAVARSACPLTPLYNRPRFLDNA